MAEDEQAPNAADENQVRHRAKKERERREQYEADVKAVMSTAAGRRVMWSLLTRAGIFQSSVAAEAHLVYVNEGRRNMGLEVMHELERCASDEFQRMWKEGMSNG